MCPGTHNCRKGCIGDIYDCKARLAEVHQLSQALDCSFAPRLARILYRKGITTREQLAATTADKLRKIPEIGRKSLAVLELMRAPK